MRDGEGRRELAPEDGSEPPAFGGVTGGLYSRSAGFSFEGRRTGGGAWPKMSVLCFVGGYSSAYG
jgi:hypothetical protein